MYKFRFVILASCLPFLTLISCQNKEEASLLPETPVGIKWDVSTTGKMDNSRSLIESDEQLGSISQALGENIEVWGDFLYNGTTYHEFKGTALYFNFGSEIKWDYTDYNRYWTRNALYDFRAYYPAKALKDHVTITDASNISINYNTENLQKDLLVAYTAIDTHEGKWNLDLPVPLLMQHALATLKFVFKMEEGSLVTNTLVSASLDTALKPIATLEYNTSDVTVGNWTSLTASTHPQLYLWENSGIDFTASTFATAYTTPSGTTTIRGTEFCDCGGHVLIIPQSCAPVLNFATAYRSYNVPLGETAFEPGKQYVYNITLKENTQLNVTLTIKNWNELGSSYDINF